MAGAKEPDGNNEVGEQGQVKKVGKGNEPR